MNAKCKRVAIKLKQPQALQIQSPNQRNNVALFSCGCCVLLWALGFGWGPGKTPGFSEEGKRTVESLRLAEGEKLCARRIIWLM